MAKDFSISSKVLDTDKYVYREERDLAKTQVDWGTISKNLTDTINTVRDERETQKAEIEKATTLTIDPTLTVNVIIVTVGAPNTWPALPIPFTLLSR